MKKRRLAFLIVLVGLMAVGASPKPRENTAQDLRSGKDFLPISVYTAEEDQELLKLFAGLRVADVSDGLDKAGFPGIGLLDPSILPLWTDPKNFRHRFAGIAVTARYVPTQKPHAGNRTPEEFDKWEGEFYSRYSSEPYADLIRPGTALVIDDVEEADIGSIGSYNIMEWKRRGCVGVVTDAGARDTDEIAIEKVPLYLRRRGRGIRPGRNEIESVNRPIAVGGVLVMPGDVVVADGDGVIVVPRAQAQAVAAFARQVIENDKAGRRELYKQLRLPPDASIKK
jgi:4-hydroxy-4-methyl-2-oxoglutarate aldolase